MPHDRATAIPSRLLPALPIWVGILLAATPALPATIDIHEGDSFEQAAENLNPGDTLVVHEGTYTDGGRVSIGVKGTAGSPVLITGAPGEAMPLITRTASAETQNTINVDGAEYLTIRGLEISSNGGDGVTLASSPSYITLEDLHVHDVDVGINLRSNMHHIVIRRNHIHATGDDGGTGEGMYIGCNNSACSVHSSLIENNWVHDTTDSTQGDGIEIKAGSHSNTVRDNVIYNTQYPCLLVYGTGGEPRNVLEGNVIWNCGDSGIQAAADAVIRNNVIIDTQGESFNSQDHQGVSPGNLEFVHNTVIGGGSCIRLGNWANKPGMVFANNAIYCGSDDFSISSLDGVTVSGNVIFPSTSGFPGTGFVVGQSLAADFVDAAGRDFYPREGSRLIDAGNPAHVTAVDFNNTGRDAESPDAGAYRRTSAENPGWQIVPGFKEAGPGSGDAPDPPENLRVE